MGTWPPLMHFQRMVPDLERRPGTLRGRLAGGGRVGVGIIVLLVMVACSASVNDDLTGTPTPSSVRTPVVGNATPSVPPGIATPIALVWRALAAGDLPRAASAAATGIALAPDDPDALAARAAVRFRTGDLDGARADLDLAVNRAPRRADLMTQRGQVEVALGEMDAARADADAAIATDPGREATFVDRAMMRSLTAQGAPDAYQAALDDANRALALNPDNWTARIALARIYGTRAAFRGDPADLDHALAELEKPRGGPGGPTASLVRAQILAARGDHEAARREFEQALASIPIPGPNAPAAADIAVAEAMVAIGDHDWSRASASADRALTADPARWDARELLAEAWLGGGEPAKALDVADLMRERWPESGVAWYLRGVALVRLGDPAGARLALETARPLLASSPVYQVRIAQAERSLRGDRAGTPRPVPSPTVLTGSSARIYRIPLDPVPGLHSADYIRGACDRFGTGCAF